MLRVLLVFASLTALGCGPVEYVATVTMQASHAVAQAKRAQAERLAPYEYTIAVESLHEARELAGHSRWQQSVAFGKTAIEYGDKAESLALEKGLRPTHPAEKRGE